MGDSAMHLLEIYRQCGLEVAEEFKGCPDHIVLELEFLSYLYRWATDMEVRKVYRRSSGLDSSLQRRINEVASPSLLQEYIGGS